jgi:general secretion pathway protein N
MIAVPRRWLRYLLLAVFFYLAFLLITLPAAWFAKAAASLSRGVVEIGDPRGTVWHGSGQLAVASRRASQEVGRLQWQIHPLWLALGSLCLDVSVRDGARESAIARLNLGLSGIRIENLEAAFPASLVGHFHAAAGFIQPAGTVRLKSPLFEIQRGALQGEAMLAWDGAGSQFYKLDQLGDYRLDLKGNGATADLALATARGDLQLSGQGQWRADNGGVLRFQGSALATGRQAELEPVLRLIGAQTAAGRREFSLNLPLPIM